MAGQRRRRNRQRGAVILFFALIVVLLLLIAGLAIDFGFAYVTRANLSKAVDAAALAGARNLYQGQTNARAIATGAFRMNYTRSGRDVNDPENPAVVVDFPVQNGTTKVSVRATTRVNTFLIGLLPQYRTLSVGTGAEATRAHVVMTMVLDKSGSMQDNRGWSALPTAVDDFIDHFDDTLDSVAVVTFASNTSIEMAMRTGGFKSRVKIITKKMNYSYFAGATFSEGGMKDAQAQNSSITPAGNVVRVVVFFTDGHANTIQDNLNCNGKGDIPSGKWNFGGHDSPSLVSFMRATGTSQDAQCTEPQRQCCTGGKFPSHATGRMEPINWQKVSSENGEAEYRAIETANAMRFGSNTAVYAIGLGNDINRDFLYTIANDRHSASFDPDRPEGEADFAPTAEDLDRIFQNLASRILLRLTQ